MHKLRTSVLGIFIILIFIFFSCKKDKKNNLQIDINQIDTVNIVQSLNKIYYSLPSPLELANTVRHLNIRFYPNFLLPTTEVIKFQTYKAKAVALGIYSADLSFSVVFSQQQKALDYFHLIKSLATDLDLTKEISDSIINEIEQNLNNLHELQRLVGEVLFKVDAFLKVEDRQNIAHISLYSGWIESLYLINSFALSTTYDSLHSEIFKIIADEYLVIDIVINMLQASNIPEKEKFIEQTSEIKKLLSKLVKITYHNEYDAYSDMYIKRKVINYNIKIKDIKKLQQIIIKIRNELLTEVS